MVYEYNKNESAALSAPGHNPERGRHNKGCKRKRLKKRDRQKAEEEDNEANFKRNPKVPGRERKDCNAKGRHNLDLQGRHKQETEEKAGKKHCSLKKVEVKFDKEAYKEYEELKEKVKDGKKPRGKPTYEQLLKSIDQAINILKLDPFYGNLIPRKYLSKKAIRRYGTDKIFRIELVGYWRLLYTLIGDRATIIAFILEYMDHKKYDNLFGYRKN